MGCVLHTVHVPVNRTVEQHHVVPVAWQLLWQPPVAPFPGTDPAGRGKLWDARTIECCPTGHRNVHEWIVELTRASAKAQSDDPLAAFTLVSPRGKQGAVAYQALTRFREVGGSLLALIAAHEWGQS